MGFWHHEVAVAGPDALQQLCCLFGAVTTGHNKWCRQLALQKSQLQMCSYSPGQATYEPNSSVCLHMAACAPATPPHTTTQLVQLGEPKALSMLHQHQACLRYVDAHLQRSTDLGRRLHITHQEATHKSGLLLACGALLLA